VVILNRAYRVLQVDIGLLLTVTLYKASKGRFIALVMNFDLKSTTIRLY
jgi:hypothetical protein